MSSHRFFLPPEQCQGKDLVLGGREAHHALRVLRLRRGQRVLVLDGAGSEFVGEIQAHDRDKVRLTVVEKRFIPRLPCQITLLQGIPKGKVIETILQKATELGAARIVPLLSARAVPQLDERERISKAARWQLVLIEALKQCGGAWLPRLEPPQSPEAFLARKEGFDLLLVAALQAGGRHPRECLRQFETENKGAPRSVAVGVGPEGDFAPAEVEAFLGAGAEAITLGPLVLRSETAAVYCLSILSYELQAGATRRP